MIEFMIIAAPRSGTAWASNWLTTEHSLCLHDPLWKHRLDALDNIESEKVMGIACTGLFMFPRWLNKHPARKVILHREVEEISASCAAHGLPEISLDVPRKLNLVEGLHVDWMDIFDKPKTIYEYLLQMPFDAERHAHLKTLNIQNMLDKIVIDQEVGLRFSQQYKEILNGLL